MTLATKAYPYENTPVAGLPAALDLPPRAVAFWGTSTQDGDTREFARRPRAHDYRARRRTVEAARSAVYDAIAQLKPQFPPGTPLTFRSDIAKLS